MYFPTGWPAESPTSPGVGIATVLDVLVLCNGCGCHYINRCPTHDDTIALSVGVSTGDRTYHHE